jgi:hypothetical protein
MPPCLNDYLDKILVNLVISLRSQKKKGILKLALLRISFDCYPLYSQWLARYNPVVELYRFNGYSAPNRRSDNEHEHEHFYISGYCKSK